MRLKVLLVVIFLFFILFLKTGFCQNSQNNPKSEALARWIMDITIKKNLENEAIKRQYVTYRKHVLKYNLEKDSSNAVANETEVYEIYGQNGNSMERLVQKGRRRIQNSVPKKSAIDFNNILAERYVFNLEREEIIDGRGYYIISFRPKEPINALPVKVRIDEGINRMIGTLRIDMENFHLKKLDGHLGYELKKGWGIFEMKSFTINLRQEEFESILVPDSMVITYEYHVLFGSTHEKLEYSYSDRKNNRPKP